MPFKNRSPCSEPGCPALSRDRFCEIHQQAEKVRGGRRYDNKRGSSTQRGYGGRWQKARRAFLSQPEHVLCALCEADGRIVLATVVDHIVPYRGDYELQWDESNWQALCVPCHNAKTAREDGGGWQRSAPTTP